MDNDKIALLNDAFTNSLGISPLNKKKLRSEVGKEKKLHEIAEKTLNLVTGCEEKLPCKNNSADSLILAELVPLYHTKTSSSDKISLLTIAAAAKLTVSEMINMFGTTEYMARKST